MKNLILAAVLLSGISFCSAKSDQDTIKRKQSESAVVQTKHTTSKVTRPARKRHKVIRKATATKTKTESRQTTTMP